MKFVSWLVNRLKEPSTYAGVASLALALGLSDRAVGSHLGSGCRSGWSGCRVPDGEA